MRLLALMTTISGNAKPRGSTLYFQGIVKAGSQTENAIKHRINTTDKANNAKDQTVASIYDNHFCIPLDFEILESSLPFYLAVV